MVPLSFSKSDLLGGWGGEPFYSFFLLCFSSFRLSFIGVPTSCHPKSCAHNSESRAGFDVMYGPKNKLSCIPKRAKSMTCFHFVKRGILGIRMVHGFMLDWAEVRSIACLERVCKGVLHGSPWENCWTFKFNTYYFTFFLLLIISTNIGLRKSQLRMNQWETASRSIANIWPATNADHWSCAD